MHNCGHGPNVGDYVELISDISFTGMDPPPVAVGARGVVLHKNWTRLSEDGHWVDPVYAIQWDNGVCTQHTPQELELTYRSTDT